MRRARITTTYADSATAAAVANAVRPDDTASMDTTTDEEERIVTTIERETTGGLHATVDDYVVNLTVAAQTYAQDGDSSTETTHS
jgi:hypothetical protein